jgi:hypothetical protein
MDLSKLSLIDRATLYFSSAEVKTFKDTNLSYKFVLIRDNSPSEKKLINGILGNIKTKINVQLPKIGKYIDITPILKYRFPQLNLDAAHIVNSFNCHNLTLIIAGFQKRQSYTTQREIDFYLNNFCEEVNQPEDLSISIYRHPMLSHSFTTLNEDLTIEKPSNSIKKHYALKRGKATTFDHYNCDSPKFNSLSCHQLDSIAEQVTRIDKYFTNLSTTLRGAVNIEIQYKALVQIQNQLIKKSNLNNDCRLIKTSIVERVNSLFSLYHDLIAGNLFGQGSYAGSGPKV